MAVEYCNNEEIQRVHVLDLTPDRFHRNYFRTATPIVILGATENWPARKWTIDGLVERVGSNMVYVRGQTNRESYRKGQKYTVRKDSFSNYCNDLKEGNAKARSSYLAVASLHQVFPELLEDVPLPEYLSYDGRLHLGPYLWVALKDHYEFCHFDPDDNILVMIQGRKRVRLFGYGHLTSLYPNPLGSHGKTVQSQVELDNVDAKKFPRFAGGKLTCQHTVLRPGEMLFIPAFYWHQVTALDTGISVNMFYGDRGDHDFMEKVLKPPYFDHFRYWFLNVVEQNRDCDSFQRMLSRLKEVVWHFFMKHWHDKPTDDHVRRIVELTMEYCGLKRLPDPSPNEDFSKFPAALKIRGLLNRNGSEAENNETKYEEYIGSTK